MAAPPIKAEPGTETIPQIKPDPDMNSPNIKSELLDDDMYEDAGDLDLSGGGRPVWLVKLPQFIADRWNELNDDEEITLGVVKLPPQASDEPSKLKLILDKNELNGLDTPAEYDLKITNLEVTNTYVFTERDMPGFENKNNGQGGKDGQPPIPQRLLNQRQSHEKKDWKNQKFKPYTRKPISKRTAIVGTARHEISMTPVFNEEYKAYQAKRVREQEAYKFNTRQVEDNAIVSNLLAPGTAGRTGTLGFTNFMKPVKPVRKATDNKAHRMAQGDLQSRLFECFGQHEYWSMKAFREKLQQPEAYLKEVLDGIAVMNKSGPFNGKWSLKPEYKNAVKEGASGVAAEGAGGEGDGDGGDDDDEVEMEDVPM